MPLTSVNIEDLLVEARLLRRARWARNTEIGYGYDWAAFQRWCAAFEKCSLPADGETLCLYVAYSLRRGNKVNTVSRRVTAVTHYHELAELPSPLIPEVRQLLDAAQRLRGEKPREMRPLLLSQLGEIARALLREGTPLSLRNRALLVVGFGSALRRSSIVELSLADVQFLDNGLLLHLQREKNDQEGHGRYIGLPRGQHVETCPERALRDWLEIRGPDVGPLFTQFNRRGGVTLRPMAARMVATLVKRSVERLGLDPTDYGGHSLRAGFVTAAGEAGAGELLIAAQTGHRSMAVLRKYFRRRDVFRANACAMIGL